MVEDPDTVIVPKPLTDEEFEWLRRLLDNMLFKVLAYSLNDNWEPVADGLGFTYLDIQHIKTMCFNNSANPAEKMLMNWFLRQANMELAICDLRIALKVAGRMDCICCIDEFLKAPFDLSVSFEGELQPRVVETTLCASLKETLGKEGLLPRNCEIVSPNVFWDTPVYKIVSRSVTLKRHFWSSSRSSSMLSDSATLSDCIPVTYIGNFFLQAYHSDLDCLANDPPLLDRTVLERMQRQEPNSTRRVGMYLLVMASRATNNATQYYLYVFTKSGNVIRCPVQQDVSLKSFCLGSRGEPEMPSINELLKYFINNPLRYKGRGGQEKNIKLTLPIPRILACYL